jgi:hypothetical protein
MKFSDDWVRIGPKTGRRSLWLRLEFSDDSVPYSVNTVPAFELRAGREGDDAHVRVSRDNPQYAELLDLVLTAQFAAFVYNDDTQTSGAPVQRAAHEGTT